MLKPYNRAEVMQLIANGKIRDVLQYDLRCANMSGANMSSADLSSANMSSADLSSANMSSADLSSAAGLLSPIDYLANFERTADGYIAYKTFGAQYSSPDSWDIKPGSIITEVVNPSRTTACGCGINVAPLGWVLNNYKGDIWRVLIRYEWLPGVVVPYDTDGKIRCERVQLLEVVERGGGQS